MDKQEAMKILKEFHDKSALFSVRTALETALPELLESEDERIRKEIIAILQYKYEKFSKDPKYCKAPQWIAWLEKQGTKRPADQVESKFHEGDWVILTAGELSTTLQIVNVDTNKKLYWFNDSSYLPIVDEECLHLWSIQDIKDGDVLVVGDEDGTGTAICGKNDDLGNNILYCYYDDENGFAINTPIALACLLHPATKEQRNLLFYKMKESGYEWDAEKKELKLLITNGGDFCESENCEQKPIEWSEEDELMLISTIQSLQLTNGAAQMKIDWLKSLKQRIEG